MQVTRHGSQLRWQLQEKIWQTLHLNNNPPLLWLAFFEALFYHFFTSKSGSLLKKWVFLFLNYLENQNVDT